VGALVFTTLYREWLHISIFSELSSHQTFVLMLVFLGLTFCALGCMVVAYVWTKRPWCLGHLDKVPGKQPQEDQDPKRKKLFTLGFTLHMYMAMHLDDTVRTGNSNTVAALETQVRELLRLLDLGPETVHCPKSMERAEWLNWVSAIDKTILAKLEVLDITGRAYYVNGKWLAMCLSAVAVAKAPGASAEEVQTLLKLVIDRYKEARSQDNRFRVPVAIRQQFGEIFTDVSAIAGRGMVENADYERLSAMVLRAAGWFD